MMWTFVVCSDSCYMKRRFFFSKHWPTNWFFIIIYYKENERFVLIKEYEIFCLTDVAKWKTNIINYCMKEIYHKFGSNTPNFQKISRPQFIHCASNYTCNKGWWYIKHSSGELHCWFRERSHKMKSFLFFLACLIFTTSGAPESR